MSEGSGTNETEPPTFREAISRARLETQALDMPPPVEHASMPAEAPAGHSRFEYRIEKAGGARREQARTWSRLGEDGWELVCVAGGRAYFKRRTGPVALGEPAS